MKAIIAESPTGPIRLVHDRSPPALRPGYLRVRTIAIALNPADSLYLQYGMCTTSGLLGCDYAGIITEIGPAAREGGYRREWKVGERVCGCTMPANSEGTREMGTFAEEIVVKGDLAIRVPEAWGWEEGASTGVTVLTSGRCLVRSRVALPLCHRQLSPQVVHADASVCRSIRSSTSPSPPSPQQRPPRTLVNSS
jgi:NADPH:quinone reductase-like Zn-dependent oxidoreductase